nr:HU family DNA-binding protein [Hoylesella enoeca]
MKAKLIERKNPQDRTKKKLYASAVNAGRKTLRDISTDISGRSSLTRGDIENVLSNFVDRLPPYLIDGFSIQLGEFGTLRISLSSKGAATAKDFNTGNIKARIIFTPGVALKQRLQSISFEIVKK